VGDLKDITVVDLELIVGEENGVRQMMDGLGSASAETMYMTNKWIKGASYEKVAFNC